MEARSGEARVGCVKISDNWFSRDGIDGVSTKLFKLRAKLAHRKIYNFFKYLWEKPKSFACGDPHAKFAIRSFLELRFAHFLCAAQEMSKCPKNEFRRPRRPLFPTASAQPLDPAAHGNRSSSDATDRWPSCHRAWSDRCAFRPWRPVHP